MTPCEWVDCNARTRFDIVPCFEPAVSVLHVLTGMTPAKQALCVDHLDEARTILFGSEVELTVTPLGGSA